jgi:succinate dehydrogenase / fumarate reductase cytochrome b subunit
MRLILSLLWSSVGKKIIMALTGLCLFGFLVGHLAGNTLLMAGPDAFNAYAHKLTSLGFGIYGIELVLVGIFAVHIVTALAITRENWSAKGKGYAIGADAGGASRKTLSSTTMIYTGAIVVCFAVFHVATFKYGLWGAKTPEVTVHGEAMLNLHQRVMLWYQQLPVVAGYVIVMVVLGFHLRHAFWSAFQSMGLHHPRYMAVVNGIGIILAIVLAFGFLVLPIFMFFKFPAGGA